MGRLNKTLSEQFVLQGIDIRAASSVLFSEAWEQFLAISFTALIFCFFCIKTKEILE